jgi:hypothetical protein
MVPDKDNLELEDPTYNREIQELASWAAATFHRRTILVCQGVLEKPPTNQELQNRVERTEIYLRLQMRNLNTESGRILFQFAFEAQLEKWGLLPVLRGEMSDEEWGATHKHEFLIEC